MKKHIAIALAGLTMLSATSAMAATQHDRQDRYERRDDRRDHREYRREDRRYRHEDRHEDRRYRDHREFRYDRRYQPRGYWGARPYFNDYGGYRAGQVYRYHGNSRYYIEDYRRYNLPPPSAGYRYYRDDNGNVVMAAIAGGVIGLILGGAMN